ncbi:FAD-binding oxidoreductase [Streptomyces sp. NPDC093510]|uniref:NAD(P)/FAD-dependent oxidoreductase n=1 Tax=Streptomyces sp. NPDC093510 TaxID=3155199 RepID=UPI0034321F9A
MGEAKLQACEVVVVGAGLFGSAVAKYLSRGGARVLVIGPSEPTVGEPVSRQAFGAYFDEARITRRLGWDEVWGALDAQSLARFRDIEAESGIEFFNESGSLVLLAKSIAQRTSAIRRHCVETGVAVERLGAAELCRQFPELGLPPLAGGVEGLLEREQAGCLNPRRLVAAQLALTTAAGGRLLRAAVSSVAKDASSGRWMLDVEEQGRSTRIAADKVVIATGAFTNHNQVLPEARRLALRTFAEPNLLFEVADSQVDQLRGLPPVVTVDPDDTGDENMSIYLLPPIRYPDDRWYARIGPGMQPCVQELRTVDEMVSWYAHQRVTPQQEALLTSMMGMLIPDLKAESVRAACCIIEKTPSRYPYVGHVEEDESLTVAVGGNGHGARGSDEIGRLAAGVVLGERWDSSVPQETFAPLAAQTYLEADRDRPEYLQPPFGLC